MMIVIVICQVLRKLNVSWQNSKQTPQIDGLMDFEQILSGKYTYILMNTAAFMSFSSVCDINMSYLCHSQHEIFLLSGSGKI